MYTIVDAFEWSMAKNITNIKKHGVSFEEAQSVFFDPFTKVSPDSDHSAHEDRLIAIGHSSKHRLLLVVHSFRAESETIRIISARRLTKDERKQYEEDL